METPRRTRADETREAPRNRKWMPSSSLPNPNHREGWSHRWVACSVGGELNTTGYSRSMNEGWVPVKAEEYPEVASVLAGQSPKGDIVFGGLTLCRMPAEMAASREEYFAERNRSEMGAVRNELAQQQRQDGRYGSFQNHEFRQTNGRSLDFGTGE